MLSSQGRAAGESLDVFLRNESSGGISPVHMQNGNLFYRRYGSEYAGRTSGCFPYDQVAAHCRKKDCWRNFAPVAFGLSVMILIFGTAAFGTYHVLRTGGERDMRENVSSVALSMADRGDDKKLSENSDYIWHNGKAYRYNDQVITLLCMGIDQSGGEIQKEKNVSGESGQADSIFLAVMDPVSRQLSVIAISRDTMTKIPAFDNKGNYLGENINHLGLAYAYGDGREKSCQYMVDAVSRLFYGIPINGYAAFSLETIGKLNDAVGGVTVTVPEGEDMTSADPQLKSGEAVTLTGDMAETFVRWRNTEEHGSNKYRQLPGRSSFF